MGSPFENNSIYRNSGSTLPEFKRFSYNKQNNELRENRGIQKRGGKKKYFVVNLQEEKRKLYIHETRTGCYFLKGSIGR